MTDGRDTTDREAGGIPNQIGVRPSDVAGIEDVRHPVGVDLVVAAGQDQNRRSVGGEDEGLDDRADGDAERSGSVRGGSGRLIEGPDLDVDPTGLQGGDHALDAGVHAARLTNATSVDGRGGAA